MKQLVFATGNEQKFATGKDTCLEYGITLTQAPLDIDEIQSEDPLRVASKKGADAFAQLGKPVIVTDDSWSLHGLNGFPGVYMHSINAWFSPEDFLRLTLPLVDRRVTLTSYLVYTDASEQKIFKLELRGTLLKEIRGEDKKQPNHTVIALDSDNGQSVAEAYHKAVSKSGREYAQVWHDFIGWYNKR